MTVPFRDGSGSSALSRRFRNGARGFLLAAVSAVALAGCVAEGGSVASGFGPKHLQELSPVMVSQIEQKGMDKRSPILIRLYKEESELEVWKQARDGKYALLKTYPICRWSGELGPKIKEGDRQAPEGFYMITPELLQPRSSYHLAFNMGYPNEFDRSHNRTGAHLMVHGDCSSRGCYAMTDEQISEIFALAREAFDGGQLSFQVQAYPFRMTAKNMARHRKNPHLAFWRMLKEGSDHFETTKTALKVDVCDRRYVFNARLLDTARYFNPSSQCPAYQVPADVAKLVAAKKQADEREFTMLANMNIPTAPIVTGRDGGTNQAFAFGEPRTVQPASAASQSAERPVQSSSTSTARSSSPETTSSASRSTPSKNKSASGPQRSRSAGLGNDQDDEPVQPQRPAPQQRPAQPQTLPGSTPILSTGGFSFNSQ
jgi:murein L,D-transpeptidase YafK